MYNTIYSLSLFRMKKLTFIKSEMMSNGSTVAFSNVFKPLLIELKNMKKCSTLKQFSFIGQILNFLKNLFETTVFALEFILHAADSR